MWWKVNIGGEYMDMLEQDNSILVNKFKSVFKVTNPIFRDRNVLTDSLFLMI